MKRVRAMAAGITGALALAAAAGAPRAVLGETLEDAWRLALARDHTLAAAQADVAGARAGERAARGARWPALDANAGFTRLDAAPRFDVATPGGAFQSGPLFKDDQLVSGSVQVKLPLYAGGAISAGIEAAHRAAMASTEAEQATSADVKLEVAQAYVDVLRARRALDAADSRVASLSAHVHDVQSMVGRELVSRADLLAARVALADAEQDRVRAANAVSLALAAYNRRIGEPLDRNVELDERLPVDTTLSAQPVARLVQRALAARSEVKSLMAQADALAARARAERGQMLPHVALTGGYTHIDNQILDRENFVSVGVGLTWSLFDGGQARNRAAALESESSAARRRLEELRSQIELAVRQAWLDVSAAQARLTASREAVSQADENLRDTRELYGAGMGTNTQVLDAVALRVRAASDRDDAVLDEALAHLRLAHAVGAL